MKKKITIDKLAEMTQKGFLDVRKELKGDIGVLKNEVGALKSELKGDMVVLRGELKGDMAVLRGELKGDMADLKDEVIDSVREENLKVLQSNDKIVTKLDTLLKEHAADKALHIRHSERLDRLEKKVGA